MTTDDCSTSRIPNMLHFIICHNLKYLFSPAVLGDWKVRPLPFKFNHGNSSLSEISESLSLNKVGINLSVLLKSEIDFGSPAPFQREPNAIEITGNHISFFPQVNVQAALKGLREVHFICCQTNKFVHKMNITFIFSLIVKLFRLIKKIHESYDRNKGRVRLLI